MIILRGSKKVNIVDNLSQKIPVSIISPLGKFFKDRVEVFSEKEEFPLIMKIEVESENI